MNFLNQCVSFALSIASRGFFGNKAEIPVKKLRVLSCFGNQDITPCEYLKKSQNYEGHYCQRCGCGDKPHTQLLINGEKYSKLDYPYLNCPLKMPGFSNYEPASPKEVSENSRKSLIEVYDILNLESMNVSSPEPSEDEYKLFEKMTKISKPHKPK